MASTRADCGRHLGLVLALVVVLVLPLAGLAAGQVVTRPTGPTQAQPPPPVNTQPYQPPSGPSGHGGGSLTPSWTPPSAPVPKVEPRAAAPAAAAPAARVPKRWCEVAPGASACRGSGTPDGGGSDNPNCDCAKDLCRTEQLPGQALVRRYCYKTQ